MILAGDIGGTNTRLAVFNSGGPPHDVREYPSPKYASLQEIVGQYMQETGRARGTMAKACFGVAGPVETVGAHTSARITNLTWTVDQTPLADVLGIAPAAVAIINDLAANANGIAALPQDQVLELKGGEERFDHRAIISAGTGLGVAGLRWDGRTHHPIPSEGGHASFAPRNELEDDLLKFLRGQQRETFRGHVSWERVLSGPGIYNLFDFYRHRDDLSQTADVPADLKPGDAAKKVVEAALAGTCPRCAAALDLFVSLYGAAAGNVALTFLALGGLYLGGGIAPRIKDKLRSPAFLDAFLEKGPLRGRVLEKIPVRVILDPHTALRGAGRYAERMA